VEEKERHRSELTRLKRHRAAKINVYSFFMKNRQFRLCRLWRTLETSIGRLYNATNACQEVTAVEEIRLGDVVQTRKPHPCGSDQWKVIRIGADIKMKCLGCGRIVMLDRAVFVKRRKKVLEQGPVPEADTLRQMANQP